MKRGIFQVHAHTRGGGVGLVDVLDLDELSFRAWLLGHLQRGGILAGPDRRVHTPSEQSCW